MFALVIEKKLPMILDLCTVPIWEKLNEFHEYQFDYRDILRLTKPSWAINMIHDGGLTKRTTYDIQAGIIGLDY